MIKQFNNTILPHADLVPSSPELERGYMIATHQGSIHGTIAPISKYGVRLAVPPSGDLSALFLIYDQQALLFHLCDKIILVEFNPNDCIMSDHRAFAHTVLPIRDFNSYNVPLVNRTIERLAEILPNEIVVGERKYAQLSKFFNVLHGADKSIFLREATRFLRKIHR